MACAAQGTSKGTAQRSERIVPCPEVNSTSTDSTEFGFAKAALVSLWYARNSMELGSEAKQVGQEAQSQLGFLTAMMRITKQSTDYYVCAKRAVSVFTDSKNEGIATASEFLALVYDSHILINERTLDLLGKMSELSQTAIADRLSTLQVDRGRAHADMIPPVEMGLLALVDMNRPENGKATRLNITKAQKETLMKWATDHFPEHGKPTEKWSDPAKTAHLYFNLLTGRLGADE